MPLPTSSPNDRLAHLAQLGEHPGDSAYREIEQMIRSQAISLNLVVETIGALMDASKIGPATRLSAFVIDRFRWSNVGEIVDRVRHHAHEAEASDLCELAESLLNRDLIDWAAAILAPSQHQDQPPHPHQPWGPRNDDGRVLSLLARIFARQGALDLAFQNIAKVPPAILSTAGLLRQARYAALTGRIVAAQGALKRIASLTDVSLTACHEDIAHDIAHVERIIARVTLSGVDATRPLTLRTAFLLEYGSLVVDDALHAHPDSPIGLADALRNLGCPMTSFVFATPAGEALAEALSLRLGGVPTSPFGNHELNRAPARARADEESTRDRTHADDGVWFCLGSTQEHPQCPRSDVLALERALRSGGLRTVACQHTLGARSPIMPDVVGHLVSHSGPEPRTPDGAAAHPARMPTEAYLERFGGLLRATQPWPRPPHVPFVDETRGSRPRTEAEAEAPLVWIPHD